MVWKWPKAFGSAILETAIIPNTSNIRLIRKCINNSVVNDGNYNGTKDDQVCTDNRTNDLSII